MSPRGFRAVSVAVALAASLTAVSISRADDNLAAAAQNPVASMISVPLDTSIDFGAENGTAVIANFQPFVNYNLSDGWFLNFDPIITANWNADEKWTVPLGGGVGRIFKIGEQPVNMRLRAYYNVVRPDAAPEWSLHFAVQLLFPK